jgi:DNA-directed RNA polymerase beta subunit
MLETLSLPPAEQRIKLREKMVEGLKQAFPIQGSKFSLHMENPTVHEREYSANEQKEALLTGRSLTEPIKGNLILKDADGKVVDRSKQVTLLNLPWLTERATYITNGNENSIASQLRLKPGVYCRRRGNEELEASWNLAKGRNFRISLEPEHGILNMEFQTSKIPLYPILKSLGVSHEEIAKTWGKELANKNDEKHGKKAEASVTKLYEKLIPDFAQKPLDHAGKITAIKEYYGKTVMDPKVNEETLGLAADKVTPEAMLKASGKLLNIFKNSADIDDRNSLAFKTYHSQIDFLKENLGFAAKELNRKIRFKLDHAGHEPTLAKVVPPSMFSDHIKSFITTSDVSSLPTQINPMELSDAANKITLMGEGGISSETAVPDEVRELHPSQFGILDPIRTPECFPGDTEVYTRYGWKFWPDVTADDELACRIDGKLEFHKPIRLIKQKYVGTMYGVKNGKIEYLVTPNHRMLCRPYTKPGGSEWRMDTAENIHNKPRTFDAGHLPVEFASAPSDFILPKVVGSNSVINVPAVPIGDWAEFMGWFISEGCCTYKKNGYNSRELQHYNVRISQDKVVNPDKCDMIEKLLCRLPFKWSRYKTSYSIGVKQLASYLKDFGYCQDKYIPQYLLEAPLEARKRLFQALLLGDGRTYSKRKGQKKSYLQQVYTTTSPQLAKDFEQLAISLGHSTRTAVYPDKRQPRYLPIYEIRVLKHRERTAIKSRGHYYTQEYNDYVYCAEVPGHLLYTRRNGSVPIWLGNSGKVGVDIRATISAFRDDAGNLYTVVLNRKTGKLEHLSAAELHKKNVAFPMKDFPKSGKVDVVHKGQIFSKPVSEVDYIIPHANFLYSTTTNLTPMPESSQGNRLIMSSKMSTQALSLKDREEPWVQVASWRKGKTMEGEMGEQATPNSPVKGKITKIDKDFIYIAPSHVKHGADKDKKDELIKVPYYTDFPLASKTYLHHELSVKEGDRVEEGQQLGESNFTKNGKIALGKNMNVAFLAYNGLNSNDGIVISEGAAKKLTSVGMYKHVFEPDEHTKAGKDTHKIYFGNKYTDENYKALDDDGVVKKGQTIHPGDPLIVSVSKKEPSPQDVMLGKLSKSLLKPYRDNALTYDGEFTGKVIDVIKGPKRTTVTVQSEEPMVLGDKLSGRYGNKGVVSAIIPDDRMPHDAKGTPIDILLTSAGVISRINPAQVIEMAIAKVAKEKGKPIAVESFSGRNNVEWAKKLLRDNGLTDKETVYDPVTGKNIPGIMVGPQYMYKLFKTTKSNYSAHGVGPYDVNEQPMRGGEEGSKGIGRMEINALIAHNARNILKENAVLKSQKNDEFWQRYRLGLPLPTLKSSFAYNKFLAMLQGSGIKVKKTDDNLILAPLTDADINELSSGKITSQEFVRAKDLRPSDGGFFDPNITGGLSGTKWSHIQLSEPVLNPIFHDSARRLLGLTSSGLDTMLKTEGAKHVEKLLGDIDLSSRSRSLKLQLPNLKGTKFDDAVKQLKYIKALKENELTPDKAWIMHKIPVIPPIMRPILPGQGGRMQVSDANNLYMDTFLANNGVADAKSLTNKEQEMAREHLNDSVGALFGLREPVSPKNAGRGVKGFLSLIAGQGSPKYGFFHSRVLKKNLDLSGRATVAPDITLGMDELGVPEGQLWSMFEPFISRRLIRNGRTAIEAKKMIEDQHPSARDAMISETKERPILFNRAPTLHKYNIVAAYPIPVQGKTLRIPATFAEKGMSMDYDGDAVSIHVPVSPAAVEEAKKMTLSNLVMASRDKTVMVKPEMESVIGGYKATSARETSKRTTKFKTIEDAQNSYNRGMTELGDKVEIG